MDPIDNETLLKIWAPDAAPWSPWVKAVPFAYSPKSPSAKSDERRTNISQPLFPAATSGCALVIDLCGGDSVRCGAELAKSGFQPVPMFASCPVDSALAGLCPSTVDADCIITALTVSAPTVAACQYTSQSPPAFLLDARRQTIGPIFTDEYFDNRSAVFAADFPSAAKLTEAGIRQILIVHDSVLGFAPDLAFALDPWRQGGLEVTAIDQNGQKLEVDWPPASLIGHLWLRLKLLLILRSNPRGGYGRFVSESSGG